MKVPVLTAKIQAQRGEVNEVIALADKLPTPNARAHVLLGVVEAMAESAFAGFVLPFKS